MSAHWNTTLREKRHGIRKPCAALELDHLCAGLQRAARGDVRRFSARLIGSKGQIRDDQATARAGNDASRVVKRFIERHRKRRCLSLDDHPERIADEQDIDARVVTQRREARVVTGQHRDSFPIARHCLQRRHRHPRGSR